MVVDDLDDVGACASAAHELPMSLPDEPDLPRQHALARLDLYPCTSQVLTVEGGWLTDALRAKLCDPSVDLLAEILQHRRDNPRMPSLVGEIHPNEIQ
jgi:hypothetical protein